LLHIHRRAKVLALIAAVALAIAACSGGSGTAAEAGDGNLAIAVASPRSGAEVSIPFEVQLESGSQLGEPGTGNHHAHLYFDTDTSAADYDIVYGNSWQVTRDLAPGEHTIVAALANPDHSLAGPTHEITVVVTEGAGASDGAAGEPSTAPEPVIPGY
jgi:hypothetical protein